MPFIIINDFIYEHVKMYQIKHQPAIFNVVFLKFGSRDS